MRVDVAAGARATVHRPPHPMEEPWTERDIDAHLERTAADFHDLLDSASRAELRAPTNGTRWTNDSCCSTCCSAFSLSAPCFRWSRDSPGSPTLSRAFAAALNAGTGAFHVVNYLSALPGNRVLRGPARGRLMDSTIGHLRASLERESECTLALAMHFPTGWDPYFNDVMTVADIYDYPTQHYDHHRRQLTTRRTLDA